MVELSARMNTSPVTVPPPGPVGLWSPQPVTSSVASIKTKQACTPVAVSALTIICPPVTRADEANRGLCRFHISAFRTPSFPDNTRCIARLQLSCIETLSQNCATCIVLMRFRHDSTRCLISHSEHSREALACQLSSLTVNRREQEKARPSITDGPHSACYLFPAITALSLFPSVLPLLSTRARGPTCLSVWT